MLPKFIDLAEVLGFVLARQKKSGGFSATPMLPPTAEDTYYALRILTTLKQHSSSLYDQDTVLKDYLFRLGQTEWRSARTTFHLLASSCMAAVPVDIPKADMFVKKRIGETADLAEHYYCARIAREVLGLTDEGVRTGQLAGDHATLTWHNASELWMNLYLIYGGHAEIQVARRDKLVAWLQACQNYDGGFGFLPGSTSFIENSYTCLRAFSLLNAAPQDPAGCQSFLVSCVTGAGGFSRASRATAFLFSTWHAIGSFQLMGIL